jgi:hypothetical protein
LPITGRVSADARTVTRFSTLTAAGSFVFTIGSDDGANTSKTAIVIATVTSTSDLRYASNKTKKSHFAVEFWESSTILNF